MKFTSLMAALVAALLPIGQTAIAAESVPTTRIVAGHQLLSASKTAAGRRLSPSSGKRPVESTAAAPLTEEEKIEQVLNRLTLGARPGDYEKVRSMGVRQFIEAQLDPRSLDEAPLVEQQLARARYLHRDSAGLLEEFRAAKKENKQIKKERLEAEAQAGDGREVALKRASDEQKARDKFAREAAEEYFTIRLMRELYSPRQLQEVMVDFWFNHFNISINKGPDHVLVGPYEEQAIRPYAMGRFRDLVGATCHHPAMLFYLDNWQNAVAAPKLGPVGKGKKSGLNENYARELMELHTLGVDGGYSQKDVTEMARVLTGLSLPAPKLVRDNGGPLDPNWGAFYPQRHDRSDKVVLGQVVKGGDEGEIEQCLDRLCRAPATAHHVSYKLAQYFVADEPPPALVERLARRFSESDGNIKEVLTTLFNSPEFFDARYFRNKYKSPFRYTISAARASGVQFSGYQGLVAFMKSQGQPLYGCLTPDGWKNTKEAWLNSDALVKRLNFATALGAGRLPGVEAPPQARQVYQAMGGHISAHTSAVLAKTAEPLQAALLLGSPEFMNY